MNKERLLDLIDVLKNKVTDKQFNMHFFLLQNDCGTVGCAAGWYALNRPEHFDFLNETLPRFKETRETGFYAMRDYFNITIYGSYYLFNSITYEKDEVSREDVIKRLNSLISREVLV